MTLNRLIAAVLAAAALHASAQAERTPSAHVRCDGNPDNVTPGESAARFLGAVTLLALFAPPPEAPNQAERLSGAEGVAICNQALARESNDVRRAQLILATAIHQIEAGDYEAAGVEVRRVESDRPALSDTAAFRHSLGLAAMEVEATALLGAGQIQEARTKALGMAAAAPYDLATLARALPFVRLAPDFGPAEEQYYRNLIRIFPAAVLVRAIERQLAGDFRGSTEDYALWAQVEHTLSDKPNMTLLAHAALAHALVDDVERAEELARQAQGALDDEPNATAAPVASEILDLYQIWKLAREGRAADARLLFGTRTSWTRPTAAAISKVAGILQEGARPEDLTGSLAGDSRRWVTELLEQRRSELTQTKNRFAAMRPYFNQASFDRFAPNVWREGRSRYFGRQGDELKRDRFLNVYRDGTGTPAAYALLLHAALTAQREGKSAFMLLALQAGSGASRVRLGEPEDSDMVASMTLDAAQVIADLSPLIPRPARR